MAEEGMRVLHVIPAIAAAYGGPSKVVLDTCKALRAKGVEAEIATTNADLDGNLPIPKESPTLIEGVPVYFFERKGLSRYKFSFGLTKWISRNVAKYDLLHVHAVFSYSTAVAAFFARRHRIPYVMLPHGMLAPWPMRNKRLRKMIYFKLIEENNLERAAAIHFTAEEEMRISVRRGDSNFVLPYIVDLSDEGNVIQSTGGSILRVLYLSRFDPKKGIEILIGALSRLVGDGVQCELILAGDGEPEFAEKIKQMVQTHGLSSITRFTGFVEGAEKSKLLRSANLFVLPSYGENFGIAVTEAMAAGLPVVISDRVNIHNEIRDAGAGVVVSPTVEALYRAMRMLASDSTLRKEMGLRGRNFVATRFSVATTTRETLQIYEDVISKSRVSNSWRKRA
jgi:glycosyltransferase involved in cell wall biosynthesis